MRRSPERPAHSVGRHYRSNEGGFWSEDQVPYRYRNAGCPGTRRSRLRQRLRLGQRLGQRRPDQGRLRPDGLGVRLAQRQHGVDEGGVLRRTTASTWCSTPPTTTRPHRSAPSAASSARGSTPSSIAPIVEDGWDDVLQEAKDADIPVVLEDRTVTSSDDLYASWVGLDFKKEGVTAGEWAAENFDASRPRWSCSRAPRARPRPTTAPRASPRASATHPIETIDSQTGDFTRDGGKTVMEGFLQKYGVDGIDLVYAHNDDMALGAIEAIEAAGGTPGEDIKIVSIDAVKDGMQALVDGKINFIVECNPLLGEQAADLVKKVLDGEDVEKAYFVPDQSFTAGAGGRGHRLASLLIHRSLSHPTSAAPPGTSLPGGAALSRAKGRVTYACRSRSRTARRDAWHHHSLPGRPRARRRGLRAPCRRGARPHGRERRREVDADQGADRRLLRRPAARSRSRARSASFGSHGGRPAGRHLDRLPGGQPLHEPLGRRERDARPRDAQPPRHRLEGHPPRGGPAPGEPGTAPGHPLAARPATRSRCSSWSRSAGRWCSTRGCWSSTSRPRASTATRWTGCSR